MSTVPFTGPSAVTASKDIKKTIRDAYEARKKARKSLEQLNAARMELSSSKADAWASEVASRGVDLNTLVTTYEGAEKEIAAHQKKIDALNGLLALVEGRIKQLKKTNGPEVLEVLSEQIKAVGEAKIAEEKDVKAADAAITDLSTEFEQLKKSKAYTSTKEK